MDRRLCMYTCMFLACFSHTGSLAVAMFCWPTEPPFVSTDIFKQQSNGLP